MSIFALACCGQGWSHEPLYYAGSVGWTQRVRGALAIIQEALRMLEL